MCEERQGEGLLVTLAHVVGEKGVIVVGIQVEMQRGYDRGPRPAHAHRGVIHDAHTEV